MAKPTASVVLARPYPESQSSPDFEVILAAPAESAAAAWNEGIRRSDGEYLAFVGPQDVWSPARLAKQLAMLCARPDLNWCYASATASPSGNVLRPLFVSNFIQASSLLIRRKSLEAVGWFNESENCRLSADWDMWLRLAVSNPIGAVADAAFESCTKREQTEQLFSSGKNVVELAVKRCPELRDLRSEALAELCIGAGNAYLLAGKRAQARDKFAEALTHSPLRSDAYLSWVSSYLLGDAPQQMRDLCNLGRRIQPAKKEISVGQ